MVRWALACAALCAALAVVDSKQPILMKESKVGWEPRMMAAAKQSKQQEMARDLRAPTKKPTSRPTNRQNSNEYASSGSNEYASSGSNEYASSGSNEYASSGSNEYASSGSNEYASSGSNEYASNGSNEYSSNGSNEYSSNGSNEYTSAEGYYQSSSEYSSGSGGEYSSGSGVEYSSGSEGEYSSGSEGEYSSGSEGEYSSGSEGEYSSGSEGEYTSEEQGPTRRPTARPSRPFVVPTRQPTVPGCTKLSKSNSVAFEYLNYPDRTTKCWDNENPAIGVPHNLSLSVYVHEIEGNSWWCADSLEIIASYTVREGRNKYAVSRSVGNKLCGVDREFTISLKTVDDQVVPGGTATLNSIRFLFVSDYWLGGKGFAAKMRWLGADQEQFFANDFAELKTAVQSAPVGMTSLVLLNSSTIYFDDTWDMRIKPGTRVVLRPAPGLDYVVMDGSRKTSEVFDGTNLVAAADAVPQIMLVPGNATVSLHNLHFRFFKTQNLDVNDAVGLIHVVGNISEVHGCRFSSNDARPVYSDTDISDQTFPKGAVIQITPSGRAASIQGNAFSQNLHTVIANRGVINRLASNNFLNNRADTGFDSSGDRLDLDGAVVANSLTVGASSGNTYFGNSAKYNFFENIRRLVDAQATFAFNPSTCQ